MTDPQDHLDHLLRDHLRRELDPHAGRSLRAFEAALHRQRQRRLMIARTSLLAASIALVAGASILSLSHQSPHAGPILSSLPPPVAPMNPAATDADAAPRDVEQLVSWQTTDEGVENVQVQGQPLPVRKLRQDALQQMRWFDPQTNATVHVTVPVEQVIFVQEETY